MIQALCFVEEKGDWLKEGIGTESGHTPCITLPLAHQALPSLLCKISLHLCSRREGHSLGHQGVPVRGFAAALLGDLNQTARGSQCPHW